MKTQDWIEKITESSLARIAIFFLFVLLIVIFTFLAFHARANLAAARAFQVDLARQADEVRTAGSMNDFYDNGWLADDQNFSELGDYVSRLVSLAASPSLDPKFRQELNDYIAKNRPRLPKEASQIKGLSFSEGILRLHQSRLVDMYEQLNVIFQTMENIVSGWDIDSPQLRGEEMITIQDAFTIAQTEFQATTASHRKILEYARLLDMQSKQDSAAGLDRIQTYHTQFTLSMIGLVVSVLFLAGWIVLLKRAGHRE